jgi:hypothetical protein
VNESDELNLDGIRICIIIIIIIIIIYANFIATFSFASEPRKHVNDLGHSHILGFIEILCFPWGPCKVVIRESSSEAGSSEVVGERERELRQENVNGGSPR